MCGVLVYSDFTSNVTRYASLGISINASNLFIKSVVSFMYDFSDCTMGCKRKSTYLDIFDEGESMELTTGRPSLFFLWIFGNI